MSNTNASLWKNRAELPSANLPLSIVFIIMTCALCAVVSRGFGGMLCIGIAGAAFGFFLCVRRDFLVWITPVLSFVCAFAVSGNVYSALATLFYLPIGIVLAMALFTRRSLSFTVTVLTVLMLIAMAVLALVDVTSAYDGTVKECFEAFKNDTESALKQVFSIISYKGADGEVYHLSDKDIGVLIEGAVMLMPAVIVLTCQLLSYVSAKLFRAIFKKLGFDVLFLGHSWELVLSFGTAVVYLLTNGMSLFFGNVAVLFYSTINIAYILTPAAAIAGFKSMFGKGGLFRLRARSSSKVFFIIICVSALLLSPLALIQFFAMFGSGLLIWRTVFASYFAKKRQDKDDDRDL